jgi:hypothetical protein
MAEMNITNKNREKSQALKDLENEDIPTEELEEEDQFNKSEEEIEQEELEELEDKEDGSHEDDEDEEIVPQKKVVKQQQPDLEERYKEQRREAQLLSERNKQLTDAFGKVEEINEPTEEELKKYARNDLGVDIDDLSIFERATLKKNYVADKKLAIIQGAIKDVKNIDEWGNKIDAFLDENENTQANKQLIGKEAKFRAFAMKESHRGIEPSILLSHFLYNDKPDGTEKKKGSLFLRHAGGEKQKMKTDVITDAEVSANLKKSNPQEFRRLLKAGKIKVEV